MQYDPGGDLALAQVAGGVYSDGTLPYVAVATYTSPYGWAWLDGSWQRADVGPRTTITEQGAGVLSWFVRRLEVRSLNITVNPGDSGTGVFNDDGQLEGLIVARTGTPSWVPPGPEADGMVANHAWFIPAEQI